MVQVHTLKLPPHGGTLGFQSRNNMSTFNQEYFQDCASYLSDSESPDDVLKAWLNLRGKHPELSAITGLTRYERELAPRKRIIDSPVYKVRLVHYFTKNNLYFISDEVIKDTIAKYEIKIPVDYTLAFDTNLSSYIKTIIQGGSLGKDQGEIIRLLDQLLVDDVNFDHFFYLTENTKQVYTKSFLLKKEATPLEFWNKLNKNFRWNLVSLELFRGIDCKKYKISPSGPESIFSFQEAARNCVRNAYEFYATEHGKIRTEQTLRCQRTILLYLIAMYRIQFASKKGVKNKIYEYFDFIQNTVGIYFDREAILAHKYFADRSGIPFLNQVNLGAIPRAFLKRLDNMAWDMAAPRFMEELITSGGEAEFMAPFFISFDKDLTSMLNGFLIKSAIINSKTGALIPIPEKNTNDYFVENGCKKLINWFFSREAIEIRRKKHLYDLKDINLAILREYRKLRRVYTQRSRSSAHKKAATDLDVIKKPGEEQI